MDFLALQTAVFGELNEDSSNPTFWTLADVKDAINEGYEEMSEISEWYDSTYTLSLSQGVRYYDLFAPTSSTSYPQILTVVKVYDATTRRWLFPISTKILDADNPVWELATGTPDHFMLRGAFRFGVFPLPTTSLDLTLYTKNIPQGTAVDAPALVNDTDTPGFQEDFHPGIVAYAVYKLLCEDAEYARMALPYYAEFAAQTDLLRKWCDNRGAIPMTRVLGGGGLWT